MSVVDNRGSVGPFERVLSKLPEARPESKEVEEVEGGQGGQGAQSWSS